jgi:hypothetical protein
MDLTVKNLKAIIAHLDDDIVLAHLETLTNRFEEFSDIKRLLILKREDKMYLTINAMGSHIDLKEQHKGFEILGYIDENPDSRNQVIIKKLKASSQS